MKKLLLLGLLGLLVASNACGKKAPPIPRDEVLRKQAEKEAKEQPKKQSDKQPSEKQEDASTTNTISEDDK